MHAPPSESQSLPVCLLRPALRFYSCHHFLWCCCGSKSGSPPANLGAHSELPQNSKMAGRDDGPEKFKQTWTIALPIAVVAPLCGLVFSGVDVRYWRKAEINNL